MSDIPTEEPTKVSEPETVVKEEKPESDTQSMPKEDPKEVPQEILQEDAEPEAPKETPSAVVNETITGSDTNQQQTETAVPETAVPEAEPEPIEIPPGNGELVLVTGATGYLASHIVKTLSDSGEFRVRGTVRSLENNEKLNSLKALLANSKYETEFVEADLLKPETWTEAVKGCDYVIHTASPFPTTEPQDPKEVIDPARDATLAVLKACAEAATVRRVVLTSSIVAISSGRGVEKNALNEETWADTDKAVSAYDKSKAVAEKAAWDYVKALPGDRNMELTVVNPGFIVGPPLYEQDCTSIEVVKKIMNRAYSMLPKISWPMCDVRDAALAHVRAMMIKQAAGHRHIISSSSVWMKDMANMLSQEFNSKGFNIPTTQAPYVLVWIKSHFDENLKRIMHDIGKMHLFDNKRMRTILQIEPRDIKDSLIEMGHSMINHGMVQKIEKAEKKPRKLTFRKKKEVKQNGIDDGEEKKDEPEKAKEISGSTGSAEGDIKIEDVKVEIPDGEKTEEVKSPESKMEDTTSDGEKSPEPAAAASSEEETKEESTDPESSKVSDKKDKKEKPKKEKKKGSIFSFSFKKNKKPQVDKKEEVKAEDSATTGTSETAPAEPSQAVEPSQAEESTNTETPATNEQQTEQPGEEPVIPAGDVVKSENVPVETQEVLQADAASPEEPLSANQETAEANTSEADVTAAPSSTDESPATTESATSD